MKYNEKYKCKITKGAINNLGDNVLYTYIKGMMKGVDVTDYLIAYSDESSAPTLEFIIGLLEEGRQLPEQFKRRAFTIDQIEEFIQPLDAEELTGCEDYNVLEKLYACDGSPNLPPMIIRLLRKTGMRYKEVNLLWNLHFWTNGPNRCIPDRSDITTGPKPFINTEYINNNPTYCYNYLRIVRELLIRKNFKKVNYLTLPVVKPTYLQAMVIGMGILNDLDVRYYNDSGIRAGVMANILAQLWKKKLSEQKDSEKPIVFRRFPKHLEEDFIYPDDKECPVSEYEMVRAAIEACEKLCIEANEKRSQKTESKSEEPKTENEDLFDESKVLKGPLSVSSTDIRFSSEPGEKLLNIPGEYVPGTDINMGDQADISTELDIDKPPLSVQGVPGTDIKTLYIPSDPMFLLGDKDPMRNKNK